MESLKMVDWQNLSKKERRCLKKKQKRLEQKLEVRKNRLMRWGAILAVVVFLTSSFFLFNYFDKKRYENAPKLKITSTVHDFGKVLASGGIAETTFEVRNVGVSPLVISGMETSCGCTTAKLKVRGEKSPKFGMHDNPTDWSASVEPGETAELVVFFDPNFHKNTFGPVTRTVSIFSNDPGKRKEKVTIYANIQR